MRSTTAIFRACSAWWPTCWMQTSGTSAPSGAGAASLVRRRHSTSVPIRWSSAISLWAEMTCFLVLGWRFPVHVFDLHTAYLATSNILLPYDPDEIRKKPRKRLSDACRAYGIEGWERIDKPEMAKAIGEGPLARIRPRGGAAILRGGHAQLGGAVAASTHRLRQSRSRRPRARHALERTTAPRPSRGSRPAACRSTCRCGISCRRTSER